MREDKKSRFHLSLSAKILMYVALLTFFMVIFSYIIMEDIAKKSFYNTEVEKAKIIARTVSPLISMAMFLELDSDVDNILEELKKDSNILSVKIFKKGKYYKGFEKSGDQGQTFFVTDTLKGKYSDDILGTIELKYSSKHYNRMLKQFRELLIFFLSVILLVVFFFALFLKKLILPLREIALKLDGYSPKEDLKFEYDSRKDEVGSISRALNNMQESIKEYSAQLEELNRNLEKEVEDKTKEVKEQYYTDPLTKLPNRNRLVKDLKELKKGGLLIINIDDFKEVNDYFGHEIGDMILKGFANRLVNLLKNSNVKIYRLSGDEFAILFQKSMTRSDLSYFINRLLDKIDDMVFLPKENELGIRVTIGATAEMESPLEKADIALKRAKKERISYMIYDRDMKVESEYKRNIELVKKIRRAILDDRVFPFFQPIFHIESMELKNYEALMRIKDQNGHLITPNQFLKVSKKSKFYPDLTKIMFEKCCHRFQNLDCRFSFNLSLEDILNRDTVDFIKDCMQNYSVYEKTIFEIVESEGIENYAEIAKFIKEIKNLGAQIAIDDFGSGYSNFEHLAKLSIDYIKIDGTLIKNLDSDHNSKILVETIVDYAQKRKIETVAEFVSSKTVFDIVKGIGIDYAQGFFLAKPSPKVNCQ